MADTANLLVSYDPNHEAGAKGEIEALFKEVNENFKILKRDVDGLMNVRVKDPLKAVKKMSELARKDLDKFDKTFHWIPIQKWCKASVKDMQKVIKELAKGIKKGEKWKLDLGKRKTKEHEKDLIIKLTGVIDNPNVDLDKPDKIVKVEIVGNKAGLSLIGADELLNIAKMKAK